MFRSWRKPNLARAMPYLVIGVLTFALGGGIAKATPPIDIFRLADATDASRLAKVDAVGNVAVSVSNLPATQNVSGTVNVGNLPAPRTLASDGRFFSVTKPVDPDPVLNVPAGVVLTSAHVSFSVPENVPNAASIFVASGGTIYLYQIVNDTTFEAGFDLESGILSDGTLAVELSCYNIAGNHCQGAIMWSGYRP